MLSILSSRQPYVQVETHPRHIADVIEVLTSSQSCTMFSCCFLLLPPVPLLLSLPATFLQLGLTSLSMRQLVQLLIFHSPSPELPFLFSPYLGHLPFINQLPNPI